MAISKYIKETMSSPMAGVIRKMFEEGIKLKKEFGEDNVFDFSLGNPDLDPPVEVADAFAEISKCTDPNFHGYMPNAGFDFAREAMAQKTQMEQKVPVTKDCIVMAVGAAGAINALFKAIFNPGDNLVVNAPYFAEYKHYVNNAQGTLVEVAANKDFSLNIEGIKNALNEKTAAVLVNSPNNPTGRIYSRKELEELAKVLNECEAKYGRKPYLVLDEPYRAITYDGAEVPPAFDLYDNSIVVTSFAKNLSLPGERIGYIAVNPACPDKNDVVAACIFTTRILGFVNAPALQQRVVAKSWNAKTDYSFYKKRRDELMEILDEAGIEYVKPEGAFYLWCKVPQSFNNDDMKFCDHLKKFNILCAPGSGFGGKGNFRIAYCVSEKTILNSKQAFIKAMQEIN